MRAADENVSSASSALAILRFAARRALRRASGLAEMESDSARRAAAAVLALGAASLEQLGHRRAQLGGRLHGAHARRIQRAELVRRRALAARDDRAGVAHALARRRGDARDVRDDRLGDVVLDELRGGFFIAAADLADQDDALGLRIALEQLEHVDEIHAAHRIAADADARALAEPARSWSGTPLRR